jgi:di/tricarboxylate transporter
MTLALFSLLLAQAAPIFTVDMLVVLGLIAVVLVLFISEVIPIDITALATMVAVILLGPWTGADPFSFVLSVTFAASCALLTPIGYQTNLMVYGPDGYRFIDFVRMGAPLQLILALVTYGGIWLPSGV